MDGNKNPYSFPLFPKSFFTLGKSFQSPRVRRKEADVQKSRLLIVILPSGNSLANSKPSRNVKKLNTRALVDKKRVSLRATVPCGGKFDVPLAILNGT